MVCQAMLFVYGCCKTELPGLVVRGNAAGGGEGQRSRHGGGQWFVRQCCLRMAVARNCCQC